MTNLPTRPDINITRPAELADVAPEELLKAWTGHKRLLAYDRCGIEHLTPAQAARHALDALATGEALAAYVVAGRWVTVAEALAHGATVERVAAAAGLDVDEVAAGMTSWADRQLAHRLITSAQHDEVIALIERAPLLRLVDDQHERVQAERAPLGEFRGDLADRQWLHARSLGFEHPADGRWVEFTSPYPADLERALELLRTEPPSGDAAQNTVPRSDPRIPSMAYSASAAIVSEGLHAPVDPGIRAPSVT
jgi:hypothetical protein